MTITEERDAEIDFSEPYYIAQRRLLVPEGSDIQGLDDLNGKRVCTALGSTYEETIREQAPDADLRLVDIYSECFELLQNGPVDAISTDNVILTGMVIQDDTLELVGHELTTEPYGVGIKDGDTEMKEFVDDVIAESSRAGPGRRPTTSGSASTSRGPAAGPAGDDAPGGAGAIPAASRESAQRVKRA